MLNTAEKDTIKQRMLDWGNQFSILCYLDSNSYMSPYKRYECLMAAGSIYSTAEAQGDMLSALQRMHDEHKDWVFGHISYDYKNALEPKLQSAHAEKHVFPELHFFVPYTVCYIDSENTGLTIESFDEPMKVYEQIMTMQAPVGNIPELSFTSVNNKQHYLQTIAHLRNHIAAGDCYEINYCNEGYCENAAIDTVQVFKALNELSPAPFAAYYKLGAATMMCASPERYISKHGQQVISQPIKGTARRGANEAADKMIKEQLHSSIKERAENVMIVDLVRNDMARTCIVGSVKAEELFGIYTYPQVHQMISTITGTVKDEVPFTDVLRYSFPMGSMTGAPKFKVMQLIEQYEPSRREFFSGTVGYITPSGNFDFNVIIRSLFYNAVTQYLSYQTGGAITYDSDAGQEWEEMRLKAWALERIFKK